MRDRYLAPLLRCLAAHRSAPMLRKPAAAAVRGSKMGPDFAVVGSRFAIAVQVRE